MGQELNLETIRGKGGRFGTRFASALLAVGLTFSMSTGVFASIGFNGGSKGISKHADHSVHHTNGSRTHQETGIRMEDSPFPNIPGYGGTIYVKVGETVTLHLHERDVALFGIEGFRKPYWYDDNGHDFKATVGIATNLDGLSENQYISNLKQYKATNDDSGHYTAYCLELYLTGKKPGTEYFYYSDSSVLEVSYYKVVVTGEASGTQNSSNKEKQEEATTPDKGSKNTEKKSTDSAPTTTAPSTSSGIYTVQSGDTLAKIALNAYGDMSYWPQVQAANADALAQTKDGLIFVGMNLTLPGDIGNGRIPPASAGAGETLYTVQAGDCYSSIAEAHFGNANRYKEIFDRNSDRLKDLNTLFEGQIIVLP